MHPDTHPLARSLPAGGGWAPPGARRGVVAGGKGRWEAAEGGARPPHAARGTDGPGLGSSPPWWWAGGQCKKIVIEKSLRVKDFFQPFDKLNHGTITSTQLLSGLSMAQIKLTEDEQKCLVEFYKVPAKNAPSLSLSNYRKFCEDIESVFTTRNLEKTPQAEVDNQTGTFIDQNRFRVSKKMLSEEKEVLLGDVINAFIDFCSKQRILVKPFFDDAARNQNSCLSVGHVTVNQFKQVLNTKLGLEKVHLPNMTMEEALALIIEKFDDNSDGMVNYMAFSNTVDPAENSFDPYSLQ